MLLVVASCCQQGRPTPLAPDDRSFVAGLRKQTVRVMTYCGGQLRGSGSGVLLGGGWVATADHVVPHGCTSMVLGQLMEARGRDARHDVMLLYSPKLNGPNLRWGNPYLGQRVVCVGWPRQLYIGGRAMEQVSRGEVIVDYVERIRVGCSFESGSSGGPVFDEQGRLIGLSVSMMRSLNDEYIVAPATAVKRLLDATIAARR